MGADKTLAGPVEDLLEALVAGHLHAKLHHLVDLLRLVSVLALFIAKFLAPLLHHLGGTGPNGLLSDSLGHTGWKGHHVGPKGLLVELSLVIDPSHHVEHAEIALHLLLNSGLDILDGGTTLAFALSFALSFALLGFERALAPPPVEGPGCLLCAIPQAGHQGSAQLVPKASAHRAAKGNLKTVEAKSLIVSPH